MRPSFVWPRLLLVSLTMAGCATTAEQRPNRLSLWKPQKPAANATKEPSTSTGDVASKSSNPFRKDSAAKSATDAAKSTAETKTETAKTEAISTVPQNRPKAETVSATNTSDKDSAASGTAAKPAGVFGPETLRLIDAELADATPEERAYWYDQLKKVDPAVIPQILQARRLTAQVVEQQKTAKHDFADDAAPSRTAFSGDSSLRPTAGEGTRFPSAVSNALGQQTADAKSDVNHAIYESDNRSPKNAVVQLNHEPPAANANGKRPFAVTRLPDGAAAGAESAATTTNASHSRNPLTRFLPMGTTGGVTQAAANSPSGVSLLPPSVIESADAQTQLDSLVSLIEAEVAQLQPGTTEATQTTYIRRHVELRMLYLMANHPERALTAIPAIDPADQEFWQQLLWAMANYFDAEHIPAAKDRASQAVTQLTTAAQRLREKADLEIRNLAFCREIAYFGNIVRFPRDEFRPGDSALVYAEIDNFKSELTVDGQYRTLLRSTLEILSPSGEVRWHKEFPATEDLCLSQRRDYFHNYQFTIPDRLPLGPHVLKLTVFDELSGKIVSQSMNFVVR